MYHLTKSIDLASILMPYLTHLLSDAKRVKLEMGWYLLMPRNLQKYHQGGAKGLKKVAANGLKKAN